MPRSLGIFLYLVFAEQSTISLYQVKLNFVFYTMYYFKSLCVHMFTCLSAHIHVHMEARNYFRCLIPQVSTFSFGCCCEAGSFTDHGANLLRLTGCCVSTYSVLTQQTRAAMRSFFHLWCGQNSVPFDYMRTALQTEPSSQYYSVILVSKFQAGCFQNSSPCFSFSLSSLVCLISLFSSWIHS